MAVILVMTAIGAWAISTDRIGYVVTHGVSMQPVYHAGDLVIIAKSDSYEIGQIAAYTSADGRMEVLHRIIGGDAATGFVLKGDNNESTDSALPTGGELTGRAVLHIPAIGTWIKPLLSPTGLGMIGFLLFSGGAATVRSRRDIPRGARKKKVKAMSGGGGSWAVAPTVLRTVGRLRPALRTLAFATAVAGFLGVVLGILGWIRPATETVTASGRSGESMTFAYSAQVPRSAAYDGTAVFSPDPVFRRLADLVDLHMDYRGEPGRIQVTGRLSAPIGWHTTIPLSQPQQFESDQFTGKVQLDLTALERRARAAGEAIGTDLGQITIAVIAQVRHSDGTLFEPQIPLTLAPLQLSLANGPASLVVDRSGTAGGSTVVDRRIGAFGYDVLTAGQARRYAVYLILAALLGAAIVAAAALRHVPLRTREQIEGRYPHLIVPVEPMASPPGKPIVMVDTFPALVKLAEKYGQMILTWRRPDGSDDFVVRDDGITYRFRITPEAAPAAASLPEAAPPPLPETTAEKEVEPEQKVEPKKAAPRKRTTKATAARPRPQAKATPPEATAPEKAPPRKRAPRRKTQPPTPREQMEDLAELNLPMAAPEPPPEPIYDFLPPEKRPMIGPAED